MYQSQYSNSTLWIICFAMPLAVVDNNSFILQPLFFVLCFCGCTYKVFAAVLYVRDKGWRFTYATWAPLLPLKSLNREKYLLTLKAGHVQRGSQSTE